ncbi:MAG: hypothetical protein WC979_00575 [Candidatus Pacearchaeota archaeon]|jgi:hypothetical protein|nr:hypothetical protein [Clostridia bacterium]
MHHYVYRIEHIETKQFYIGSRSSKVHPRLDNYLGSMSVWKPDKTKLKKEILKDDFICREDAIKFESDEIAKFIDDPLNENYYIPNKGFHTVGTATVKDANGKIYQVSIHDARYLAGELIGATKGNIGYVYARDDNGVCHYIETKNDLYLNGILQHHTKGTVVVRDEFGVMKRITVDEFINSDKYTGIRKDILHTESTKKKISDKLKARYVGKESSQYGSMWIHNSELKQNKKIKKEDEIPLGWHKGRKMKF